MERWSVAPPASDFGVTGTSERFPPRVKLNLPSWREKFMGFMGFMGFLIFDLRFEGRPRVGMRVRPVAGIGQRRGEGATFLQQERKRTKRGILTAE